MNRTRSSSRFLPLCALLPLSFACVTAGEGQQIHAQLDKVEAEQKADHDAAANDKAKREADDAARSKQLQDMIAQLNIAARKSGADLAVDMDKAKDDVAKLNGAIEVINHRLDVLEQADVARDQKLDQLMQFMTKRQAALDVAEHPVEKGALYALALKKLDSGDTARARELFIDFLARFKGDPLASNAQYWLARPGTRRSATRTRWRSSRRC